MLRKFAVLVLVLVIGVIGGALGQSRLSASHRVAAPRRALGDTARDKPHAHPGYGCPGHAAPDANRVSRPRTGVRRGPCAGGGAWQGDERCE